MLGTNRFDIRSLGASLCERYHTSFLPLKTSMLSKLQYVAEGMETKPLQIFDDGSSTGFEAVRFRRWGSPSSAQIFVTQDGTLHHCTTPAILDNFNYLENSAR